MSDPLLEPYARNGAVLLELACQIVRCRRCQATLTQCSCDVTGKLVVWTICDGCQGAEQADKDHR